MPKYLNHGYTLIELMIVVVVVAIFAAIAIPSYQYVVAKTYEKEAQAQMQNIAERLEHYRGRQLTYAEYIPENQEGTTKGIIHLPHGSGSDYNYKITLVDINDSTKSLEESKVGQGWKMIAVPNQLKNRALRQAKSYLLDSRGLSCESQSVLATTSTSC